MNRPILIGAALAAAAVALASPAGSSGQDTPYVSNYVGWNLARTELVVPESLGTTQLTVEIHHLPQFVPPGTIPRGGYPELPQTVVATATGTFAAGRHTVTVDTAGFPCGSFQIDLIRGPARTTAGEVHTGNELGVIYGADLVDAVVRSGTPCVEVPPTTVPPTTTTTAPPTTTTPPTAPTTTTTAPPLPEAPPAPPVTAPPGTLPVTGSMTARLGWVGAALVALGVSNLLAARRIIFRRR